LLHAEGCIHLPANGVQVRGDVALLGPVADRGSHRSGARAPEINLILNRLGKVRISLGEMEEQTLELLAIQIGQQRLERGTLLNRLAVRHGEERGNDVLAPATVGVRARASGLGNTRHIEGAAHAVWLRLTPLDQRLEHIVSLNEREHGSIVEILPAALESISGGVTANGGFSQME
jgi:hypothetical protein